MQLPERSQVKSNVSKEWERTLTAIGNIPITGKAKDSQEIVTFLHRVSRIVLKHGEFSHIETSEM